MPLVIEGILATEHEDGSLHYAPMGPVVDRDLQSWTLKPFQTSTTFRNLQRTSRAVFHVTDDCYLLAAAAIGVKVDMPSYFLPQIGWILTEACHWYALQFDAIDVSQPRAVATGRVIGQNSLRPFWGWNRGKHAVLEAAILATRKNILPPDEIAKEWEYLVVRVKKTGGEQEHRAMGLLAKFLELPYSEPAV
jgi:uncharacterized protein